jgi:UDP-N-acetylglucosamine transferase subunit ALG13
VTPRMVVVSAGSYHLPFDRLRDWMEPWVTRHSDVRVVVQHGPSRPIAGAENHDVLPYHELLELCRTADAVVLQGGAGGVMDMRAIGRVPIVVPRVPVHDEVVDEHQLIFTDRAEKLGAVHRATSREQLWALLEEMLGGRLETHAPTPPPTPGIAVAIDLLAAPPSRIAGRVRMRRMTHSIRMILRRRPRPRR